MSGRTILFAAGGALALAACVLKADGFSGGATATPDAGSTVDEAAAPPELEAAAPVEAAAPDASVDAGDAASTLDRPRTCS